MQVLYYPSKKNKSKTYVMATVHTAGIAEVHDVPFDVIIRPLESNVNEDKVLSIMETIQDPDKRHLVPPLDLHWIKTDSGNYYYSFGGCHRFEAYKRLNSKMIPCKIVETTPSTIATYLGSSAPDFKTSRPSR